MTYAVIPAAGKSSRMGRPKLALPVGEHTILERVIAALRQGGVEHILVVVGPQVPELVPLAERANAHAYLLDRETGHMRETVEKGLAWLEEHFHPRPRDAWLLVPADHPTLEPSVIRQLLAAEQAHAQRSIFVPTYEGRRGHPTLIRWQHVAAIRRLPAGEGLNRYFRGKGDAVLEVPVASPGVLIDLDTPDDYARLLQNSAHNSMP